MAPHTVKKSTGPRTLHDRDFHAWTRQQAALLRAGRLADADLEHLIEEIEDMGSEQMHAVRSHLRQVVMHLLKLRCSPADGPRRGWKDEVRNHRAEIEDRLDGSPSLRPHLDALLAKVWPRARRQAAAQMADHGERTELPRECPFTLAQALDDDHWPERALEPAELPAAPASLGRVGRPVTVRGETPRRTETGGAPG